MLLQQSSVCLFWTDVGTGSNGASLSKTTRLKFVVCAQVDRSSGEHRRGCAEEGRGDDGGAVGPR